jgi:hypothetical protein
MLAEREQVAIALRDMLADLPFASESTDWITAFQTG